MLNFANAQIDKATILSTQRLTHEDLAIIIRTADKEYREEFKTEEEVLERYKEVYAFVMEQ